MYVVRTDSVGATRLLPLSTQRVDTSSLLGLIDSSAIDGALVASWKPTKVDGSDPGYDRGRKCFMWGHRPPDSVLFGVHGLGAPWTNGPAFKICPPGICPAPTPTRCPPCEAQPGSGGPGGELAPPTIGYDEGPLGKYGVQIGLIAAAVLTGGVGYYGYKKGWFKRKKR